MSKYQEDFQLEQYIRSIKTKKELKEMIQKLKEIINYLEHL